MTKEIDLKEIEKKKMITRHEAAAYFRVSLPTIDKTIRDENFTGVCRIRQRVVIDREALEKWIKVQSNGQKTKRYSRVGLKT